jgi:hypothetical protein
MLINGAFGCTIGADAIKVLATESRTREIAGRSTRLDIREAFICDAYVF